VKLAAQGQEYAFGNEYCSQPKQQLLGRRPIQKGDSHNQSEYRNGKSGDEFVARENNEEFVIEIAFTARRHFFVSCRAGQTAIVQRTVHG
jgi:hypothetical protein